MKIARKPRNGLNQFSHKKNSRIPQIVSTTKNPHVIAIVINAVALAAGDGKESIQRLNPSLSLEIF